MQADVDGLNDNVNALYIIVWVLVAVVGAMLIGGAVGAVLAIKAKKSGYTPDGFDSDVDYTSDDGDASGME